MVIPCRAGVCFILPNCSWEVEAKRNLIEQSKLLWLQQRLLGVLRAIFVAIRCLTSASNASTAVAEITQSRQRSVAIHVTTDFQEQIHMP